MADDLVLDGLYHLATPVEWQGWLAAGQIAPASLAEEGFVHCSWGRQVAGTVAKHFGAADAVLALAVDADAVGADLVEEDSYGSGQAFPHIYRAIRTSEVGGPVRVKP